MINKIVDIKISFTTLLLKATDSLQANTEFKKKKKKLSEAISDCLQDTIIVLGGDFNCTLDQAVDRNHEEPHPSSAEALRSLINHHSLIDLWRDSFPGFRQYTWLKKILLKC